MNKQRLVSLRYPVCILALAAVPAQAANWTTGASVTPAVTYTDNVCLSADNEQGEWIGLLTPDVDLRGEGRRANVSLAASVEMNTLTDSTLEDNGCNPTGFGDREQFAPRIRADADAILIDNWFFIDVDGTVDQNEVTPFRAGAGDSLNRNGNTNTTYRYSVSPYVARRFKDFATLELRYTWDDQYNTEDFVGESSEESVELNLTSGTEFYPLSWGLRGDYSKVDYSDSPEREDILSNDSDNELKSARVELGYQINRSWQVNGYYGSEWNDFISEEDDIDGDFWDVGVRWTPNTRTTVEAGRGDRFFGRTTRFSARYRHKRSELSASYTEDITYDRDIRALDSPSSGGGEFGSTTRSNSPILDERFTLGYSYGGRRFNLRADVSHSDQTRAEDGRDSTFKRASISIDRDLSRQLSLFSSLSWNEEDPKGQRSEFIRQTETWTANLGARHQLGQNTQLTLDYQYTDRESDNLFDEYKENRVTLSITFAF